MTGETIGTKIYISMVSNFYFLLLRNNTTNIRTLVFAKFHTVYYI